MSMAESASRTGVDFECGKCSHLNAAGAKFCGGCGHALFELCAGCNQSVRLTDRFCGGCGTDLDAVLRKRIEQAEQSMLAAVQATKEFRYSDAVTRFGLLTKEQDYRLAEIATQARQALEKVTSLRDQVVNKAAAAMEAAARAAESQDRDEVVRLLESVPSQLLDEASTKLLAQCRAYVGELSDLAESMRGAIAEKNWPFAGVLIDRMMEMRPEEASYRSLAGQIAARLMSEADRLFSKREYGAAVDFLDAVPATNHDTAYAELRQKIDHVEWLNAQFEFEPYATPTLGRLAVRLSKQSPDDPRGKDLVTRLAARLKQPQSSKRHLFPDWTGSRRSQLGGEAAILGWPLKVDCRGDAVTKKLPGRFSIAIGLALQGLGIARVSNVLWEKKSLLGAIASRRKAKMCWGIDIGNAGVRAVLLQRDAKDNDVAVIQAYSAEFAPATRLGKEGKSILACRDAIKSMLETINIGSVDVFANFSSRETLVRFLELPPVDDKKAKSLLDAEVVGQFPLAADELNLIKWFADKPEEDAVGRPAAIVAARKFAVTNRIDFLTEAGLKITALQCEALALINFAAHEFAGDLNPTEPTEQSPDATTIVTNRPRSAIAIVDAGAASTTVALIEQRGFWFRTIEGGGEELTMNLARSAKVVADEAEKLKRDPSGLANPATDYPPVEERQEALARRLGQVVAEPLKQTRGLTISQTWAVGGACLAHGWLRRVLCRSTE